MRINDEVDTNKDELLDERQSTAQKPKRDRNRKYVCKAAAVSFKRK